MEPGRRAADRSPRDQGDRAHPLPGRGGRHRSPAGANPDAGRAPPGAAPRPGDSGGRARARVLPAAGEGQGADRRRDRRAQPRAGDEIDNWIDRRTRLGGGVAIENWTGRPRTAAISGRLEFRPFTDRLSLEGGTTIWRGRDVSFAGADAAARWRSTTALTGIVWRAGAGYRATTADAPASIWPGADSGTVRDVLLRAHPLLDDGVIRGGVFGRRLAFGSL